MDYQDMGGYGSSTNISTPPNVQASGSEGPKKALWIALFFVLFLVVFIILFMVSSQHSSKSVSNNKLAEGTEVEVSENKSVKFRFGEEKHNIKINLIGLNSADITIESEPIKAHLILNQPQFFDLNNDNENDIRVNLEGIRDGRVIISVKRVDGGFCVENWQCSEWGNCINRVKTRKCIGLNDCGKESSSPVEKIFCIEDYVIISLDNESLNLANFHKLFGNGDLTCNENNASICSSLEKCNGSFINSSDSFKCCSGECIPFSVNESFFYIECDKEIREFREASAICKDFSMNCDQQTIFPALGLIKEFDGFYELKGYANGSCIFYYEYKNVSVNYSEEKIQELLETGKSLEQIEFEIESLNKGYSSLYEGKNITCYYPQNDLKSFLYKWEIGKETWSLDVLGKYNCTGDLAEDFSEN